MPCVAAPSYTACKVPLAADVRPNAATVCLPPLPPFACHPCWLVATGCSDFQHDFRINGIPDKMYNTDVADDTECVTWCAMGGQIGPIPLKKGRKVPSGGVRQRVEHLGGLRCVVAEKDEGSDELPVVLVVLAHGIHVFGDDLCTLAEQPPSDPGP